MFCHNCGNMLPQGHRFCQKCGADNLSLPQQSLPPYQYTLMQTPPPYRQQPPFQPSPPQRPFQPSRRSTGAKHPFVTDVKRSKVIFIFGIVLLVWWHFLRTLLYQAFDYEDTAMLIIRLFNRLIVGAYITGIAYAAFKRGFQFALITLVPITISDIVWLIRDPSTFQFGDFFIYNALLFGMIGFLNLIKRLARREFSPVITCVIISAAAIVFHVLQTFTWLAFLFVVYFDAISTSYLISIPITVLTTAFAAAATSVILFAVYERKGPSHYR